MSVDNVIMGPDNVIACWRRTNDLIGWNLIKRSSLLLSTTYQKTENNHHDICINVIIPGAPGPIIVHVAKQSMI